MQYMLFGQQVITFNNVCLDQYWAKLAQHILILQETHKHVGFWGDPIYGRWTSLTAQSVKNLPAMQETWVQFLGWEDPLEKEMAIHSSILAWKNPMDRGAWWATVHGVAKSQTRLSCWTECIHSLVSAANTHLSIGFLSFPVSRTNPGILFLHHFWQLWSFPVMFLGCPIYFQSSSLPL